MLIGMVSGVLGLLFSMVRVNVYPLFIGRIRIRARLVWLMVPLSLRPNVVLFVSLRCPSKASVFLKIRISFHVRSGVPASISSAAGPFVVVEATYPDVKGN